MFNWISSLKKSFKHYLLNHDSYTPVSAMTKNDIEKIINKIKEKDESSINENETNHQTIKKYFVSLKVILYLILTICSLLGAIGPGKEFVMDILEKETHGNSKIDLDISKIKPSKTMYKIPMSISFDYLNPMFLDKYSNLQNSFFYQINSINYSSNDKRFKIEQILYGKTK